jgi:hypothetical protein
MKISFEDEFLDERMSIEMLATTKFVGWIAR